MTRDGLLLLYNLRFERGLYFEPDKCGLFITEHGSCFRSLLFSDFCLWPG